jgi:hypothetical protein
VLAIAAASLPFAVEGRFGILGTSFNPDMSQHLLAADRLAHGADSQLLSQGYPLGPHAIVVALNKGLGVGLVQGFSGLTVAVAVLASLTALAALGDLDPARRTLGALLVGLPYMVASYFAQGAFKETIQALFVLAFALCLWGLSRPRREGEDEAPGGALRAVPLTVLAAGSVYAYSFPGLIWLVGMVGLWALVQLVRGNGRTATSALLRAAARPAWLGLIVFGVLIAPELGRMLDFRRFETFDPSGPGLGNLFGEISPAEALGIWPSGDFRLTAGAGAVPAIGFYAGVAFALALLAWGVMCWLRRGETALPVALAVAAVAYGAARAGGTPYSAAKAVAIAAPIVALIIVRPLLSLAPLAVPRGPVSRSPRYAGRKRQYASGAAAAAFVVAAAGCSALALANAPVGPTGYSPALTSFRPDIAAGSALALVPADLLDDEHGVPYVAWELRGGRVCIEPASRPSRSPPGQGIGFVITWPDAGRHPPFTDLRLERGAGGYLLWRRIGPSRGPSPCPLIAVRQARQGEKQGG